MGHIMGGCIKDLPDLPNATQIENSFTETRYCLLISILFYFYTLLYGTLLIKERNGLLIMITDAYR